jgi:hypothetical protein
MVCGAALAHSPTSDVAAHSSPDEDEAEARQGWELKSQMQTALELSQLDTAAGYDLLKQRIDQAGAIYDDLVKRADSPSRP